ncbi:MAG TPA: ParB/RepB/Spo0J family partition protein [Vicinamibacteria bacterium]|nr:ParB/RepB/Spo0J family partition protein [Vicinamibacteria bacterium]
MSSARRSGLPESLRMRHETHYVDQLTRPGGAPFGRLIPIEDIDPNPNQPRQAMGDLSELVASIKEKGILEPILVRPAGSRFQIIAGERRYHAAQEVGLAEIPCVVRDSSDAETMELALIENLQRKDLSAFEEADALRILTDTYGYTHEKMAEKLGKSRTSLTETLSLTAMPEEVRQLCRLADIASKSLLLQVVRQGEPQKMVALIEKLQQEGATREVARRAARQASRPQRGRPRHYVFRFQPKEKGFSLALQFRKSQVPREEIVRALQSIIEALTREDD